ncbi:MAG: hypothetical protein GYB68_03770 [Chloroflexi bacterium]|nr:hypothetical protein [Chloroflexota bacterium]
MQSPTFSHYRSVILLLAPALLALAIGLLLRDFRLDDSFITYRYARNLAEGAGFVYNSGEWVLSTTNPLYTLLLAGLAHLLPFGPPLIGRVVGSLAIGLGGGLLALLMRPTYGWGAALCGGLLYASFPLLWLTMGLETPLQLALGIAAVVVYLDEKPLLAALLIGLATLTRPDMLILVGVLGLHSLLLQRRVPLVEGAVFAVSLLPWLAFSWLVFDSPLPATLGAKSAQAALGITGLGVGTNFLTGLGMLSQALVIQSPGWLLTALIAGGGLLTLMRRPLAHPAALIFLSWGLLHILAYLVLGVAPYRWYYTPLLPALAALFALGVNAMAATKRPAYLAGSLALLSLTLAATGSLLAISEGMRQGEPTYQVAEAPMLAVIDWQIYREAGEWLKENTAPSAVIGVAEVGQIGYYAERPMVDYLGLLQPAVTEAISRGDIYWWLPHYMPDYLVLSQVSGSASLFGHTLAGDSWFEAFYDERHRVVDDRYLRSPLVIYQRQRDALPMMPLVAPPVSYGDRLLLTGLLADVEGQTLVAGQPLRLQSAWQLSQPMTADQRISLRLLSWDGSLAGQNDRHYRADLWPTDEGFTIYHTMLLREDLTPGLYTAEIAVEDETSGGLVWQVAARLKVPLPAPVLTDLIESDARLAEYKLLGYAVEQQDENLAVALAWQAERAPSADVTLFIHLLDDSGELVAQFDGPPGGVAYPSSLWADGEAVRGDFSLSLASLPPGRYQLMAGLYTLEGGRLTSLAGLDTISLAEITLTLPE